MAALLFVCVVIVYLPGLVRVFDFHDSFFFFAYEDHLNCAAHPQAAYLMFSGRPLFALISCGVANLINTVSDAKAVRLLELAILSASGTLIVAVLRAHGVHLLAAVGAVVGLMSVPGWQLVLSMSMDAPVVWSLLPVLGAFLLVRRIVDADTPFAARVLWLFAGAIAFLLIGSLTYQQSSSILFALCAIPVVLSPLAHGRRLLLLAVTAYAVSGVLYLVVHRLLVLPLLLPAFGATSDRFAGMAAVVVFSTDPFAKARFFWELTPRALGLWFLDPPAIVPLLVAFAVATGAIGTFRRDVTASNESNNGRRDWRPAVQRLAMIALLVPLSVAPLLLARGGLVVYRHIIGYQWLIVLFIVAAFTRWASTTTAKRALVAAALTVTLVAGIYSYWNFDRNLARINEKELEFIQAKLAKAYKTLPADVVVIQPDTRNLGAIDSPVVASGDEFGKTSTMYSQDVPWVVYAAAIEMGLPRERVVSVSIARPNPATGHPQVIDNEGKVRYEGPLDGVILIDMREFVAQVRRGEF